MLKENIRYLKEKSLITVPQQMTNDTYTNKLGNVTKVHSTSIILCYTFDMFTIFPQYLTFIYLTPKSDQISGEFYIACMFQLGELLIIRIISFTELRNVVTLSKYLVNGYVLLHTSSYKFWN